MAVINQDMMPPVPPMHHPPGHQAIHPTEVPRAFHPQHPHTPAPVNPAQLADEMARLRMNATNLAAANDQKARSFTPHKDFEVRVPAQYVGYTFFKADVPPGQKPTWSHAERTRMHLSQPDLIKMVQRKGKKLSSAQQYQTLKKLRRTHVDQLINEHRQSDPRFEWTCVYVNEDEKPFKGKNSRRGDYETVSMDVILMRKPVDTAHPNPKTLNIGVENSGLPFTAKDKPTTNVEELLARGEQQQASHDFMKSAHLARAGMQQGQTPGMVNQPAQQQQQQLHPQFQQQMPSQAQLNHPQGHPAGIRPQMNQVHQASLPRGMPAAVHQQPEFLNNSKSVPSKGPEIEILQQGMGGFPADMNTNMNTPRQAQGSNSAQNLFAQHLNQQRLSKENFARVNAAHGGLSGHGGIPHQGGIPQHGDIPRQGGLPHQGGLPRQGGVPGHGPIPAHAGIPNHGAVPNHAAIPRAPNVPEAEHEWGPENSSIGDDESIFLDEEDLSSITDGSSGEEDDGGEHEGDADLHGKAQPWRGSLFRRHSSKSRRQEPVYRTHYRKHSKTGVEGRNGRTKYPAGYIDVVPAESKNSTNRLSKVHTREVARPARDRPKIIHSASDNFDMVAYDEKYRGLRARNDIRTRILDDREARVERREKLVDYRTQMLDDRLDEARYLNRCMSMRESGGFYPRRYYLRDAL